MAACKQYSNLDYQDLPTLFLEFHGSDQTIGEAATIAGMNTETLM